MGVMGMQTVLAGGLRIICETRAVVNSTLQTAQNNASIAAAVTVLPCHGIPSASSLAARTHAVDMVRTVTPGQQPISSDMATDAASALSHCGCAAICHGAVNHFTALFSPIVAAAEPLAREVHAPPSVAPAPHLRPPISVS
jgi:hypothetical protein